MPKSSGDLADEIEEEFSPEDYYNYTDFLNAIESKYGTKALELVEIERNDPRFQVFEGIND
jgi:hypothetical protein